MTDDTLNDKITYGYGEENVPDIKIANEWHGDYSWFQLDWIWSQLRDRLINTAMKDFIVQKI